MMPAVNPVRARESSRPTGAYPASGEQRFRLSFVSWEKYEQMVAWFDGRHARLTYDRGELELMTVSHRHENAKHFLGLFLVTLAELLDIDIHSGGSMTFKREDLDKGLEPDECYWVEHEPQMRGKQDYDQENDPPPDLVIEVEVSRSVMDRMGIYAAMKVPEVWRWDGEQLHFCLLRRGKYVEGPVSRHVPVLAADEVARFMGLRGALSEIKLLRAFREWVREQQAQGWPTAPSKPGRGK
jgi:Uma2 family endonuclease